MQARSAREGFPALLRVGLPLHSPEKGLKATKTDRGCYNLGDGFLAAKVSLVVVVMPPFPVFVAMMPSVISTISTLFSVIIRLSSNVNRGHKTGFAFGTIVKIVPKDVLQKQ
jgi:hypothetical protein